MSKDKHYSQRIAKAYGISDEIALRFIRAAKNNISPLPRTLDVYVALCKNPQIRDPLSLAEFLISKQPDKFKKSDLLKDHPNLPSRICHPINANNKNKSSSKKGKKSSRQRRLEREQRRLAKYRKPKRKGGLSYDKLIAKVANLMPTSPEKRVQTAKDFLEEVERYYSPFLRLPNKKKLLAIQKANDSRDLTLDGVIKQARKLAFGSNNDPDKIRVIYTPMGGKNK